MLYESHALQDAIASCPVDCIHWVEKDQLPALEYVMRNKVPVTDVGTMMGGAGYRADVFAAAANFLKKREKEYVLVLHMQKFLNTTSKQPIDSLQSTATLAFSLLLCLHVLSCAVFR